MDFRKLEIDQQVPAVFDFCKNCRLKVFQAEIGLHRDAQKQARTNSQGADPCVCNKSGRSDLLHLRVF